MSIRPYQVPAAAEVLQTTWTKMTTVVNLIGFLFLDTTNTSGTILTLLMTLLVLTSIFPDHASLAICTTIFRIRTSHWTDCICRQFGG